VSVLVDTGVWSLMLRRRPPDLSLTERVLVAELRDVVGTGRALMLGAIRQELLTGISDRSTFERLRDYLRVYEDVRTTVADRELAAAFANELRTHGVSDTHVDALICAVAVRMAVPIFTEDPDFARYAQLLPILLHR